MEWLNLVTLKEEHYQLDVQPNVCQEVLWWTHYMRRLSSFDPSFLLSDFHVILAILNGAVLFSYGSPGYYVTFRFPLF